MQFHVCCFHIKVVFEYLLLTVKEDKYSQFSSISISQLINHIETGARKENLLDVCQLVVSLQCCCNEYRSIHTQRVLLHTYDAQNSNNVEICLIKCPVI